MFGGIFVFLWIVVGDLGGGLLGGDINKKGLGWFGWGAFEVSRFVLSAFLTNDRFWDSFIDFFYVWPYTVLPLRAWMKAETVVAEEIALGLEINGVGICHARVAFFESQHVILRRSWFRARECHRGCMMTLLYVATCRFGVQENVKGRFTYDSFYTVFSPPSP